MATQKDKFAVISKFEQLSKKNGYARQPINKYAEQWAADALIQSYGIETTYSLMEYYFKVNQNPQWKRFVNIADNLYAAIESKRSDDAFRAKNRQKMKEWLDES